MVAMSPTTCPRRSGRPMPPGAGRPMSRLPVAAGSWCRVRSGLLSALDCGFDRGGRFLTTDEHASNWRRKAHVSPDQTEGSDGCSEHRKSNAPIGRFGGVDLPPRLQLSTDLIDDLLGLAPE